MTELLNEYKPSVTSLFAIVARKPITIWAHCQFCYIRTEQVFECEDVRHEYYRCVSCRQIHSFAVR